MHKIIFSIILPIWATSCAMKDSGRAEWARDKSLPQRFESQEVQSPEVAESLSKVFSDKNLKRYMRQAFASNPNVKVAAERIIEAGFNTRKARATQSPSLSASGSANRNKSNFPNLGAGFFSNITDLYKASLDAQWEVDVWGRLRAQTSAQQLDNKAIIQDFEAAAQSVAAQTAQAYFNLVASQKRQSIAKARLESLKETKNLAEKRFENGTGQLSTLELAQGDVATAEASVISATNDREQSSRTLNVLIGNYPTASLDHSEWPTLKKQVAADIPSTVLLRRPDIQAAYTRILSADKRVKVAHRDLYPSFSLTASSGQQSTILQKLANGDFSIWSIAGSVSGPLLDGGSRRAELGAANSRAEQALSAYQKVVLDALAEVESALGAEKHLRAQQSSIREALELAQKAESRLKKSYERGTADFLALLEAQRRRFIAEENLINLTNMRYQNRVSLALALGKAY